jgi:hypothetical protein
MPMFHAPSTSLRRLVLFVLIVASSIGLVACGSVMMLAGHGARRPLASEFGLGPRVSAQGRYAATLVPERPLRPRQMQTLRVVITDAQGQAVDGATLAIDGGMPQHGHGLPTRPRATRTLGDGAYEIEGVRFSMGGWWEFRVAIAGGAGADVVTFHLEL